MTDAMRDLIQSNRNLLRQSSDLLAGITDANYCESPSGLEPHRVGGHLRHILEFYECFLSGLRRGFIDYDSRRRDPLLESSRAEAIQRIQMLLQRLTDVEKFESQRILWVKAEASKAHGLLGNLIGSTVGRELQMLSSHTVHHFALIAVTLRVLGVEPHPDFGMAPSTLMFHSRKAAA